MYVLTIDNPFSVSKHNITGTNESAKQNKHILCKLHVHIHTYSTHVNDHMYNFYNYIRFFQSVSMK